jgi:ATP-dependent Lhr-like helicase
LQVRLLLQQRGACFANDIQRIAGLTRPLAQHALWELATAGLAAADGFDQLRALMNSRQDPRRKHAASAVERKTRSSAGRWSLLSEEVHIASGAAPAGIGEPDRIAQARRIDAALESAAKMLLARYGVVFRDLLARESNAPKWRDLLGVLRRLEARGEARGGRFVSGFGGEQFALPEAVESLRLGRSLDANIEIRVAAADPMNLAGIVVPGERVASVPGKSVQFRNGLVIGEEADAGAAPTETTRRERLPRYQQPAAPMPAPGPAALPLFQ